MKLSDAIALGRTLVKPRRLAEYFPDGSGCARGMALEACGARAKSENYSAHDDTFFDLWPWTIHRPEKFPCECFGMRFYPINAQIQHLFDSHITGIAEPHWTLDQLIDWVRSVEPAEAPAAPLEQPLEHLSAEAIPAIAAVNRGAA